MVKEEKNQIPPYRYQTFLKLIQKDNLAELADFFQIYSIPTEDLQRAIKEDSVSIGMRSYLAEALYGKSPLLLQNTSTNPLEVPSNTAPIDFSAVFRQMQIQLFTKLPKLRFVISSFSFQKTEKEQSGTDGKTIYYAPKQIKELLNKGRMEELEKLLLHMMIHAAFGHLNAKYIENFREKGKEKKEKGHQQLWNLSCDIAALAIEKELLYPKAKPSRTNPGEDERWLFLSQLPTDLPLTIPEKVYAYFNQQMHEKNREYYAEIADLFTLDDHSLWYDPEHPVKAVKFQLTASAFAAPQPSHRHFGLKPGSRMERIELQKQAKYDFRAYLRRLTVSGEEMQLDLDSFDYIYYLYGLQHYKNMPLIEPLEYAETNKVQELVIAIDTSGSCDAQIVARFLAETCRILTDKENFFRHMNVHIIQCDSMIQNHAIISSLEDWDHYIKQIRIVGRGGTDFTPVFRYVDQLIEEGHFHQLKGLLYFTDGDGVYPKEQPSYETAFVFLNKNFLNYTIPDWAICLCLERIGELT